MCWKSAAALNVGFLPVSQMPRAERGFVMVHLLPKTSKPVPVHVKHLVLGSMPTAELDEFLGEVEDDEEAVQEVLNPQPLTPSS